MQDTSSQALVPSAMDKWDLLLPKEARRAMDGGPRRPCVPCPCPPPSTLPPMLPHRSQGAGLSPTSLSLPPSPEQQAPRLSRREFVTRALQHYEHNQCVETLVAELQTRPDVWRAMEASFADLIAASSSSAQHRDGGGVVVTRSSDDYQQQPSSPPAAAPQRRGDPAAPHGALAINLNDDFALRRFFSQTTCCGSGTPPAAGRHRHRSHRPRSSHSSCGSSATASRESTVRGHGPRPGSAGSRWE